MPTAAIGWMRAVRVVAITDRRLMVPAATLASGDLAAIADAFGASIARALGGAAPGTVLLQVREKDLDGAALLALVRSAIAAAGEAGHRVMVNDRADVALAAGADGVQLPELGLAIADARALQLAVAPRSAFAIGASRHDRAGTAAAAAAGADLAVLGPIWPTPSKAGLLDALGADILAIRRELAGATRLVAVGGIDSPERARAAVAAGADSIAMIRAVWTAADPRAALASFVAG